MVIELEVFNVSYEDYTALCNGDNTLEVFRWAGFSFEELDRIGERNLYFISHHFLTTDEASIQPKYYVTHKALIDRVIGHSKHENKLMRDELILTELIEQGVLKI
jgi:hypothetical protein